MTIFGHRLSPLFMLLAGTDGFVFILALNLAVLSFAPQFPGWTIGSAGASSLLLAALAVAGGVSVGLYDHPEAQTWRTFAVRFAVAWQVLLAAAFAGVAVFHPFGLPLPSAMAICGAVVTSLMLMLFGLHLALVRWVDVPFGRRRVLIYGDGEGAEAVTRFVTGAARRRFHHLESVNAAGVMSMPMEVGNVVLAAVAPPVRAPLSELAETLRVDEIVVALDDRHNLAISELLDCRMQGVQITEVQDFWEREIGKIDPLQARRDWLTFSHGFAGLRRSRPLKRAFDCMISLSLLLAVLPVTLLVAAAIWLESGGPVFYRQERVGLNGRVFRLWKFRSMRLDAESDGVPRWAGSGDDRVTHVGRFIRKVRLDEIPQVLNVLAGDMSFIGPRPERPFFVEQLREQIPYYELRHRVRPGITGWAQVSYPYGASLEDARQKLGYDLYYLKKNGPLLDFAILLQTVRVVLFAQGAR